MNHALPKRAISIILGTEKVQGIECINYIERGLAAGYRMIDTAQAYQNETEIGQALRKSGVPRREIHLTTKISSGFKKNPGSLREAEACARASIARLDVGFVDQFLIHSPGDDTDDAAAEARRVTWLALESLVQDGVVKSIGVCNYTAEHILEMRSYAKVFPPKVNQLEVYAADHKYDQGLIVEAPSLVSAARNDKLLQRAWNSVSGL
jgi:diketogulonate reductase-like aldo/keto reductase